MADTNTVQPVEDPKAADKQNEDMTVANGKGKQCKFVAIQNYQDLYSSLLIASSNYKNKSSLESLYQLTDKLYSSAEMAWDALMEHPESALKALGNTAPEDINIKNVIAMESVEAYVPVCPVLEGTAESIAVINDWKTKIRDIQSKLRVRINSLKLDAEKISETEQKTSNAFNNILFFITNDPMYHGDILIKNCKECKNVTEMQEKLNRLNEMLMTFTDTDNNDANINRSYVNRYSFPADFQLRYRIGNIPNLCKWKAVVGRCFMILKLRNSTDPEDQRRLQYA